MHIALSKWPINQFKPVKQSRQQAPWAYYSDIYTVPGQKHIGLLANSPSSNKGMQIRRWATIKLKQWVLYNRSKILHMAVPKEGISCLYLVKTWVLYINAPATTSYMIWLQFDTQMLSSVQKSIFYNSYTYGVNCKTQRVNPILQGHGPFYLLKQLQNKKGQKKLRYPKKSSPFLWREHQIFLAFLILKWLQPITKKLNRQKLRL